MREGAMVYAWIGMCIVQGGVLAQSDAASNVPTEPSAHLTEDDTTWLTLGSLDEDAWAALSSAYRTAPILEHWDVAPADAEAEPPSRVVLRVFSGAIDSGEPPTVRIELGSNLHVSATGDRLRAAHAKNPKTYYEVALAGGVSCEAILDAMPHVPFPQLCLALDRDAAALRARFAEMRARVDPVCGRLQELAWTSQAGRPMRAARRTTITDQPEAPQAWMIDIDGRERVGALTDLTPLASDVHVGDRVPAMGLFDDAWAGWAWDAALQELAKKPPQPAGRTCAVLVVSLLGEPLPIEDADALRTAWKAALNVERDLEILRLSGKLAKPRAMATLVGVVEVVDVGPAIVKATRDRLEQAGIDASRLRWTSIGKEAMRRIVPEARSAIVVLDVDQVLRGVVRIDGRMADIATLERELRSVLDEANDAK